MPNRLAYQGKKVTRRTFAGHVFGIAPDKPISELKKYLHEARLTPAPDEKLDLVMLDSYEHFTDLLAEHGVPLARDDDPVSRPMLHVPRRRYVALIVFATLLLPENLLDVIRLTPWL